MMIRSNPEAEYYTLPDPNLVMAIRPAPTPEEQARYEEIVEMCNRITWHRLREQEERKRAAE